MKSRRVTLYKGTFMDENQEDDEPQVEPMRILFDLKFAKDTTFGNSGVQVTNFGSNFSIANALVIQSDGKIVVAGQTLFDEVGYVSALARYNTNGTLDTSSTVVFRERNESVRCLLK